MSTLPLRSRLLGRQGIAIGPLDQEAANAAASKGSREQQIRQLAKAAGHSLDAKLRCVTCSLAVPVQRSIAHVEAVLHLRCVGNKALKTVE